MADTALPHTSLLCTAGDDSSIEFAATRELEKPTSGYRYRCSYAPCSIEFVAKNRGVKFCSIAHFHAQRSVDGLVSLVCVTCGSIFQSHGYRKDTAKFCENCKGRGKFGKHGNLPVNVDCANCGANLIRHPSHLQPISFCNRECNHEYQRKNPKLGEANPLWAGGRKASVARCQADPVTRLASRAASAIRRSLHSKGLRKNNRRWETLVGYTRDILRRHLERQFTKGMTWENYGQWHIDHIIPLSQFSFTSTDDPEWRACWALSNLRPMWGKENISKGDKRTLLL